MKVIVRLGEINALELYIVKTIKYQDNLLMVKLVVYSVLFDIKMVMFMKEALTNNFDTVKVNISTIMEIFLMDNGKIIKKYQESLFLQMEENNNFKMIPQD